MKEILDEPIKKIRVVQLEKDEVLHVVPYAPESKDDLTFKQVTDATGLTRSQIYTAINKGELVKATRTGIKKITKESFENYIKLNR
jgi:predicted DNA-binding transcriptional regulator AlpA